MKFNKLRRSSATKSTPTPRVMVLSADEMMSVSGGANRVYDPDSFLKDGPRKAINDSVNAGQA